MGVNIQVRVTRGETKEKLYKGDKIGIIAIMGHIV